MESGFDWGWIGIIVVGLGFVGWGVWYKLRQKKAPKGKIEG